MAFHNRTKILFRTEVQEQLLNLGNGGKEAEKEGGKKQLRIFHCSHLCEDLKEWKSWFSWTSH